MRRLKEKIFNTQRYISKRLFRSAAGFKGSKAYGLSAINNCLKLENPIFDHSKLHPLIGLQSVSWDFNRVLRNRFSKCLPKPMSRGSLEAKF